MTKAGKDAWNIKELTAISKVLAEYFHEYFILEGGIVYGDRKTTDGYTIAKTHNEKVLEHYSGVFINGSTMFRKAMNDLKVTKTDVNIASKFIEFLSWNDADDVGNLDKEHDSFKIYKAGSSMYEFGDLEGKKKSFGTLLPVLFDSMKYLDCGAGINIPKEIFEALANKEFVNIGGALLAKSSLPLTEKVSGGSYIYAFQHELFPDDGPKENDVLLTADISESKEYLDNFLIVKLSYDCEVDIYKIFKFGFVIGTSDNIPHI